VNQGEWVQAALRRYEAPLILYAARICGEERARDAVQETFLALCAARRDEVEAHLAAWLFTVCRNAAVDLRRKDEAMKNDPDVPVEEQSGTELDPATAITRGDEHGRVLAVLARLPEKQQEVLRLKFQGGLSYREIASVTGNSIGNVGFLIHVALRALRERLVVEGRVS
jgi:RNA polymerase sigma factor (sigma-70 family)